MSIAAKARAGAAAYDLVTLRVLNELNAFTTWLGSANGIITEIGWPSSNSTTDWAAWNRVVSRWVGACNRANLPVFFFVAQGSPGTSTGQVVMYTRSSGSYTTTSINTAYSQVPVAEKNLGTSSYFRGVHVFGPDANDGGGSGNATIFNNSNLGTYGTSWWYEPAGTYTYLAGRGYTHVRIPFKWERLQPTINTALDATELGRLQTAVTNAGTAGLKVILDCHSYGAYMLSTGRFAVGSSTIPITALTDLWTRLSTTFSGNTTIQGYSLMNEPHDVPSGVNGESPARVWEVATQACVDAIRGNSDTTEIHVPVYEWAHAPFAPKNHPNGPWIVDAQNKIRYDAHHYLYFNRSNAGNYPDSYQTEESNVLHTWARYMTPGRTWASLANQTWSNL